MKLFKMVIFLIWGFIMILKVLFCWPLILFRSKEILEKIHKEKAAAVYDELIKRKDMN